MNPKALSTHFSNTKIQGILYFLLYTCLACIAILSLIQTQRTQADLAKHRLLSLSIQDLILQSHALHYVADNRPSQGQLFLENRGYRNTMELLNQLDARLTLAEISETPELVRTHLTALRSELETLINNHREQGNNSNKKIQLPDSRTPIEHWFSHLYNLNRTLDVSNTETNGKYKQLLEQNNLLAFLVIGIAAFSVLFKWWPQSTMGQYARHQLTQFRHKAHADPLTNTLNQSGWIYQLSLRLNASDRANPKVGSIAILSIDYFKQYSDTFGTEAANQRLCDFSKNLRTNSRPDDVLARLVGEEFALFLPHCSAIEAKQIIDRIRHNRLDNIDFSAGVTQIFNQYDLSRLMATTDQALHQAQHNGGNQTTLAP